MRLDVIEKDITVFGIVNTSLYIFISLLLLPVLHRFTNIKVSILHYIITCHQRK